MLNVRPTANLPRHARSTMPWRYLVRFRREGALIASALIPEGEHPGWRAAREIWGAGVDLLGVGLTSTVLDAEDKPILEGLFIEIVDYSPRLAQGRGIIGNKLRA